MKGLILILTGLLLFFFASHIIPALIGYAILLSGCVTLSVKSMEK